MRARKTGVLVGVSLLAASVVVSGCATRRYVDDQVGVVGTRLDQTDARLAETDRTAREALERAMAAGKLAEGKFLYSMVLQDDSVKFPLDQSQLSPEAEAALASFAERLKSENKNVYVEIQGHTDATGPEAYNDQLGARRAEAVRRYLHSQGVALNRLATISYGEEAPVAPNETREGRAANRRVVLMVLA